MVVVDSSTETLVSTTSFQHASTAALKFCSYTTFSYSSFHALGQQHPRPEVAPVPLSLVLWSRADAVWLGLAACTFELASSAGIPLRRLGSAWPPLRLTLSPPQWRTDTERPTFDRSKHPRNQATALATNVIRRTTEAGDHGSQSPF